MLVAEGVPMIKHRVSLRGPGATGGQISGFLLKELLQVLCEGTKGALRLRLDGRSSAPGNDPRWLEAASDFIVTGLEEGSTVLTIDAAPLSQAVPDKFQQLSILLDHTASAFKMFEQSLTEAVNGQENSDLFDEHLLRTYSRFSNILGQSVESIEIINGRKAAAPVIINSAGLDNVKALRSATPHPQAVKLSGQLETIRYSDKMFELVTQAGEKLRGVAPANWNADDIGKLWGSKVTVDGTAVFRPSGNLLRLEATTIVPARPVDLELWSEVPAPSFRKELRELNQPQSSKTGLNKLWGQWPGNESDEQVREALRAL